MKLRSFLLRNAICGAEPCYDQSVKSKKICKPAYVPEQTFVNELLDTPNGFIILMGVLCSIAFSLWLLQLTINHFESTNWWFANLGGTAGNIVSLIVFLSVMIKLNEHTFDIKSFCLMNSNESICRNKWPLLEYDPENIDCSAIYKSASNNTSNVMAHYDGYSGFIKIDQSQDTDFTRCRYFGILKNSV